MQLLQQVAGADTFGIILNDNLAVQEAIIGDDLTVYYEEKFVHHLFVKKLYLFVFCILFSQSSQVKDTRGY